ncbi:hypothetical protein [Desulfogranum japonicum]|uniref:hypothetical protein n=1 Tax=Desulfogranum japonicum TaxID=231447 RepID=UPI0004176D55|nr:hypothetical protein [Desulfogranum japonicum]
MNKKCIGIIAVLFVVAAQWFSGGGIVRAAESTLADVMPQLSSDASFELTLRQVSLRKGVVTVQAIAENIAGDTQMLMFDFQDSYLIDLGTNKKYMPLKDEKGLTIAGPMFGESSGGYIKQSVDVGKKVIFWIKFPAPSDQVKEIDCFIPGFPPFESVPVQ